MSSIPLPALDIKPPQQPDVMGDVGRLLSMKTMLNQQAMQGQEMQLRQQQVKDQQATTAAMKNWDGQDYGALSKSVLDNGGSANAALEVVQHGITVKKNVSDIAAQDATTGSKNLETYIKKHEAVGNTLGMAPQIPDAQLHDWANQQVQNFQQNGILNPQEIQQAQQMIQNTPDPKQLRTQIDVMGKVALGAKNTADQQKTQADTAKDSAQTDEAKASTAKTQIETQLMQQYGTPAQQEAKYVSLQTQKNMGGPMTPQEAAFSKAYEKLKTMAATSTFNLQNSGTGSAMAQAVANGTMKWGDVISPRTPMSVKNQFAQEVKGLNPNFDTSTFAIEQKAAEKATSGTWADTRVAYNTALDHSKQLLGTLDALDNGDTQKLNSLKNYFKTQFGSPDVSNYQAVANAYNHEVTSVVSKGHITDAEVKTGGAVLPDNASPQQIRAVVASYNQLMTSKRAELDKQIRAGADHKADSVLNQDGSNTSGTTPPTGGNFFSQFGGTPK